MLLGLYALMGYKVRTFTEQSNADEWYIDVKSATNWKWESVIRFSDSIVFYFPRCREHLSWNAYDPSPVKCTIIISCHMSFRKALKQQSVDFRWPLIDVTNILDKNSVWAFNHDVYFGDFFGIYDLILLCKLRYILQKNLCVNTIFDTNITYMITFWYNFFV